MSKINSIALFSAFTIKLLFLRLFFFLLVSLHIFQDSYGRDLYQGIRILMEFLVSHKFYFWREMTTLTFSLIFNSVLLFRLIYLIFLNWVQVGYNPYPAQFVRNYKVKFIQENRNWNQGNQVVVVQFVLFPCSISLWKLKRFE